MRSILKFYQALLLSVMLLAPLSPALALIPVGGKVVSVAPCITGGLVVNVVGFGIGSGVFLYTPATLTFLYGPPFVGRWVLGLAAVPPTCGLPIYMNGTSPAL